MVRWFWSRIVKKPGYQESGGGGYREINKPKQKYLFCEHNFSITLSTVKKGLAEKFAPLIIENSPFALTCKI